MRYGILMALLLWCSLSYAQKILAHEKRIDIAQKYQSREINFVNVTDNIVLSGTLLEPKTTVKKVVIVVPGSGKDTRHAHHRLTQSLLNHNIAVYRFDDRGVGKSQGLYSDAIDTLVEDLLSAVTKIRSSYSSAVEVGLVGHSLAGMATVIASQHASFAEKIDFLVQISSPVNNFSDSTKYQIQTLNNFLIPNCSKQATQAVLEGLLTIVQDNINAPVDQIQQMGYAYLDQQHINRNHVKFWSYTHVLLYRYNISYYYKNVDVPTMYLIGLNDQYINPKEQITSLKDLNNPHVTVKVFSDLNHYLSRGTLQNKDIYAIDKSASQSIVQWINRI